MNWQDHVNKWKSCQRCSLHQGRHRVVLARGKIPADVVFLGEAPGDSENVTGLPFDGPAGAKLDSIVKASGIDAFRLLFANLVGCFPSEAKASGDHRPPPEAIKACAPRVSELIEMAKPQLIVLLGDTAQSWYPDARIAKLSMVHPSAILQQKMEIQKAHMTRRCIVQLSQAMEKIIPF